MLDDEIIINRNYWYSEFLLLRTYTLTNLTFSCLRLVIVGRESFFFQPQLNTSKFHVSYRLWTLWNVMITPSPRWLSPLIVVSAYSSRNCLFSVPLFLTAGERGSHWLLHRVKKLGESQICIRIKRRFKNRTATATCHCQCFRLNCLGVSGRNTINFWPNLSRLWFLQSLLVALFKLASIT